MMQLIKHIHVYVQEIVKIKIEKDGRQSEFIIHAYIPEKEAAKKFPRWTNVKRRPTESVGGKILRSIIEEIAAVEDAIIEYKKDFFIVNYIGREDTILDYVYVAHVGDIEDLDDFEYDEEEE